MGAPLLLGIGEGENFAASDTSALLQVTQQHDLPRGRRLRRGDAAGVRIVDRRGHVRRAPAARRASSRAEAIELGAYRHYMQKEIFEQPARDRAPRSRARSNARIALRRSSSAPTPSAVFAEIDSVPDPRLRHQLPRGPGRALLAGKPRRPALQRRDRERVPLPRQRARTRAPWSWRSPSRARPPTRSPRSSTRSAWAKAIRSPSATCPSPRWSGPRRCAS